MCYILIDKALCFPMFIANVSVLHKFLFIRILQVGEAIALHPLPNSLNHHE